MFQPQPAAAQRRHRRLPSGTMVSYAEVKSYLSKREIPQLFESLMAGLMYHRPENHIGYLQTCLDEVKTNSDTKVHWSTFVNKKRKSKEILPPLTPPKKQDSFSSSWSDNSRQSTPLPPISAKTRDLRNTYILYHNPPPILAKPRVPVISVLGGLGSRIDELCEKVVGRLSGVVHISTCSMLKTRMTIEGFYRVTSVPACAVVDSVLQAMSMVQSATALLVAGFPRSRGDIEEYRSRRVRMDGVVLVDFEEEALRRFLKSEVSSGAIRIGDIESELERYKQDIISVAEYYDEKDILTVVMGDQDTDEMIDDMVMAVDRIIETRKHVLDEDSVADGHIDNNCGDIGQCKSLLPTPNGMERPSTVEISEATEEDIKSIEAASRNSKEGIDDKASENDIAKEDGVVDMPDTLPLINASGHQLSGEVTNAVKDESDTCKHSTVPILFAFENIKADSETLKNLVVNEMGMCYINFYELVRSDVDKDDRLDTKESLNLLQSVLQRDSVSYAGGFFISDFPFDLLKENNFEKILELGDVSFVCKVREKSFDTEADETPQKENLLFESPMSEQVRILFVTEKNIVEELKTSLNEIVNRLDQTSRESIENIEKSDRETELLQTNTLIDEGEKNQETITEPDVKQNPSEINISSEKESRNDLGDVGKVPNGDVEEAVVINEEVENPETIKDEDDLTSREENEESTCQDVEDIITDDTLDEGTKQAEDKTDVNLEDNEKEDTLSLVSEGDVSVDAHKDKPVLARQQNLDVVTTSASESTTQLLEVDGGNIETDEDPDGKTKLIRQETFVSTHATISESDELPTDTGNDKEANESNPEGIKKVGDESEAIPESLKNLEDSQQPESVRKDEMSEKEAESSVSDTSQLQEEKDAKPPAKDEANDTNIEEVTENRESNTEEDGVQDSQPASNSEVNDQEIETYKNEEQCLESVKESNENDVEDEAKEVDDHEDTNDSSKDSKIDTENGHDASLSGDSSVNDPKEQEKSSKSENAGKANGNEGTDDMADTITEYSFTIDSENVASGENQMASEERQEMSDTNASQENGNNDVDELNVEKVDSEVVPSSNDASTGGDSENSQIEASKQDAISVEAENYLNKSEEAEKGTDNDEVSKEENSVCEDQIENAAGEDIHAETPATEIDVPSKISKTIDNDSDSYDEKSQIIETQAEVHAPDSESPPLVQQQTDRVQDQLDTVQEEPSDQEKTDVQEAENAEATEKTLENVTETSNDTIPETDSVVDTQCVQDTQSAIEDDAVHESQSIQETDNVQDTESAQDTQSAKGNDSANDSQRVHMADIVQEVCLLTEKHPAVIENDSLIIVDTDIMDEECDILDCDVNSDEAQEESTIIKEVTSETTEDSQVTTIHEMSINERYSAKIQERNGSGILGDSRQEDHSGVDDEPQERSSSSSRGEL